MSEESKTVKVLSKALKLMVVQKAVNPAINQEKVVEKERNLVHQKEKTLMERNPRNRRGRNWYKTLALLKRCKMFQMATLWFQSA